MPRCIMPGPILGRFDPRGARGMAGMGGEVPGFDDIQNSCYGCGGWAARMRSLGSGRSR